MSWAAITYTRGMGRWEPDAQGRLRRAALELFAEQGYDRTTVAEIADRAGLTERTFFRHFADKREVLFSGSAELERLIVAAVQAAPASASPLDQVTAGLGAAVAFFEDPELPRRRQVVIASHPELQERELIKMASLASAVAATLRTRGVPEPAASLGAEAGVAVFRVAFERWVDPSNEHSFAALVEDSLAGLRSVVTG